jgi:predicted ATPase
MGAAPSGTVTFLFTDIESSTRMWEEQPEQMRALVEEHDARVRAAVEANAGYVVKGMGDGVHAAFARAADAVQAATDAQAAISDLTGIRARMGLNTGEAQERDGDYFGPAVNRASRLMSAGHGGQVLLSGVTAELVPGLTLRNLGEHRLRDLGSPMVIFQLGGDDFPPLKTLDALPGNLPMQRTSFIGRAAEVQALGARVGAERLVTLTGVGGVGKSRLALQVAADVAPAFPDGTWFVSLASLDDGALVAPAILGAIGVPERREEQPIDTLVEWARGREALLVLDNCEHLLDAVAEVVDRIIGSAAGVTVLATSQAPLGVAGEHNWTVMPLGAPHEAARDSIALFVDRARHARADFELTPDNEPAVVEVCERLDHIPLAIELAAARVRGMTPADIARRLDQRLRLLTSTDRLAPGRHRTLDAAMRWSYELLDVTQQRVLDRLAVFAGPFTIEAAEAVAGGDGVDDWAVLDSLLALVDKSLVLADDDASVTRYRLLETMRHFGSANLDAAGTRDHYRKRHADYYAEFVLSRRDRLLGSDAVVSFAEVDREFENIRVAMRHDAGDETSPRFEHIFGALYQVYIAGGRQTEGLSWANEVARRTAIDRDTRIVALGFAATVAHNTEPARGMQLAREAVALAEPGSVPPILASSELGINAVMQGDNTAAVGYAQQVLELANREPDAFIRATALSQALAAVGAAGDLELFVVVQEAVQPLVDELDNDVLKGMHLNSTSPVIHLIDPDGAAEFLRRVQQFNLAVGNLGASHSTMMFLALHELRRGHLPDAARASLESLELALSFGAAYLAQMLSVSVAIVRRVSPPDAAILLGAVHAERDRTHLAGTSIEAEAEVRYEASLRRILGDASFEARYAEGRQMDEAAMVAFAFEQLAAIAGEDASTPA